MNMVDFVSISKNILCSVQQERFAGYDPFDFLNSSIFNRTGLAGSERARLVWLQFGKRSPVNFRPLVGVPKKRNPKGIGLFILGMLEDFKRTHDEQFLHTAIDLADWLLTHVSEQNTWQFPCWGYHFDWQARAFFVPKGKPNIITTCYIARALFDLGKLIEREDYVKASLDAALFIHKYLLTRADGRTFFAYIPGETAFVHNASLWGAAWVARAGVEMGNTELQDSALTIVRQSVNEQCENGAWVYGARRHHQFIDGFHTGYNLEAIDMVRKTMGTTEFDHAIASGMDYYRSKFFLEDGTAKYYHNKIYPLDVHSFSQGVLTLLKVGGEAADIELSRKIMLRAVETMYLFAEHRFIYQHHRWFTNSIDYIRWTQAWAYYGLAFFNRYMAENNNEN